MVKFHIIFLILIFFLGESSGQELKIYVSPTGNDINSGLNIKSPKGTVEGAILQIKKTASKGYDNVRIILLDGDYYLKRPIIINQNTIPLSIVAMNAGE